jgi:hypothetical protein
MMALIPILASARLYLILKTCHNVQYVLCIVINPPGYFHQVHLFHCQQLHLNVHLLQQQLGLSIPASAKLEGNNTLKLNQSYFQLQ